MQELTPAGQMIVNDIVQRYNLSQAAVIHMLIAVNNGGGTMAQFNSPELGGSGQWMRGGMTMVGDMFNHGLTATVDNLCNELSNALANTQMFPIIQPGTAGSNQWWPQGLGAPFSSGGQNNIRYAVFPQRLAVERNGEVTVYDTLDHQIGGVSQQQGGDTSLTFSSQYGTVAVSSLPVVMGNPPQPEPQTNFAAPPAASSLASSPPSSPASAPSNTAQPAAAPQHSEGAGTGSVTSLPNDPAETLALIEKLANLHEAGVLTADEFGTKKAELLARL